MLPGSFSSADSWVAVLLVPVVIYGFIPSLGSMKRAELRAQTTGQTVPPGALHIEQANNTIEPKKGVKPRISTFILPMIVLVVATLSASTFGSHACFYADATVLTAQATGCTPMQDALTQISYALIAASISLLGYLLIAFG